MFRFDGIKFHATGCDRAMPTGAVTRLPFMAIAFRAVHDIAEVQSINTNPLVMVADRAVMDMRNKSPA